MRLGLLVIHYDQAGWNDNLDPVGVEPLSFLTSGALRRRCVLQYTSSRLEGLPIVSTKGLHNLIVFWMIDDSHHRKIVYVNRLKHAVKNHCLRLQLICKTDSL